ncbi:GABA-specific permease [Schizosaccharomyces pombe]
MAIPILDALTSSSGKKNSAEFSIHSTSNPTNPEEPNITSEADNAEDLAALGYKQEFQRGLSLFSVFSVSFSLLGLLPSVATTLPYSIGYTGTPGLLWGWLIAMVFILCIALSMAELCSAMPTSGGLYYAAAVLAPEGWGPLAAWFTGWSNYIAQLVGGPSINYSTAAMLLGAVNIGNPNYEVQNYQLFLVSIAIQFIHFILASMPTKYIAKLNSVGTYLNTLFLFISMIVILAMSSKNHGFNETSKVWSHIENFTDWPDGFAILMSFCGVIWTMSGYDAPFHMSEETANASVNAPRGIILTAAIGGIMGWVMQIVIAYTVVDQTAVVTGSDSMWATYLSQCLPKRAALGILSLTIVSSFLMGQSNLIASSRIAYSYARDGVLPYSEWVATVNPITKTPIRAVFVNFVIGVLILFLAFAGAITIGAVFSVTAIAAFTAFVAPVAMRVFFVKDADFRTGPFNLGKFSKPIGFCSVSFVALMIPILCFPSVKNPTPAEMNWTCLVFGAPMLAVLIWYAISGRKWFKGPRVNLASEGDNSTLEGVELYTGSEELPQKKEKE